MIDGPRIEVAEGVPAEVSAALLPHIERWAPIVLPRWLNRVRIEAFSYDEEGMEDTVLTVEVLVEYRYARLYAFPRFFDLPPASRSEAVLHEMAHAAVQPLGDFCETILEAHYGEEAAARKVLEESLRRAWEGAVEDVAGAVIRAATLAA